MPLSKFAQELESQGEPPDKVMWSLIDRLRERRAKQQNVGKQVRLVQDVDVVQQGYAFHFCEGAMGIILSVQEDGLHQVLVDMLCVPMADDTFELLEV